RGLGVAGDVDHWDDSDRNDDQRGERALLKAATGGELVDVGRERLDVEWPQQQRRRQFLQAVDEHQKRRAPHRRAGERQMDGAGGGGGRGRGGASVPGRAPSMGAMSWSWVAMGANPACAKPIAMARKRIT